ncbi:MAG: hypothetical protein AAFY34_03855 [Pseudomonadota bacterium]
MQLTGREKGLLGIIVVLAGILAWVLFIAGWAVQLHFRELRFVDANEKYAEWDKTCLYEGVGRAHIKAGVRLMKPDALTCMFEHLQTGDTSSNRHRRQTAEIAAKLYVMTSDEVWLQYRPCSPELEIDSWKVFDQVFYAQTSIPARNRNIPTFYKDTIFSYFDCSETVVPPPEA